MIVHTILISTLISTGITQQSGLSGMFPSSSFQNPPLSGGGNTMQGMIKPPQTGETLSSSSSSFASNSFNSLPLSGGTQIGGQSFMSGTTGGGLGMGMQTGGGLPSVPGVLPGSGSSSFINPPMVTGIQPIGGNLPGIPTMGNSDGRINTLGGTLTGVSLPGLGQTPCEWTNWGSWLSCTETCGTGGFRSRYRNVLTDGKIYPATKAPCFPGGNGNKFEETGPCDNQPKECGPSCKWAEWNALQPCSASCGKGYRIQDRFVEVEDKDVKTVVTGSQAGQYGCNFGSDMYVRYEECEADVPCPPPPKNCQWAQWNEWDSCSVTCGVGLKMRFRNVIVDNVDVAQAWDVQDICGLPGIYFERSVCFGAACPQRFTRFRIR